MAAINQAGAKMHESMTTAEIGGAFESKVATCYEALGYKIDRNAVVANHQIDMLVSRYTPGANISTYAVEAKFREKGAVGVNEVQPFINTAQGLITKGLINGAVMVCNTHYSGLAKGMVVDSKTIMLLTLADLESEIFSTSEALYRCCADYEGKAISQEYIALPGQANQDRSETIGDAATYLKDWASDNSGLMPLVGDFGSGKTTVVDRLFYDFAKARIDTGRGKYPIKLPLRSLLSHGSQWSFINASLRDLQYITTTQSVFKSMLESGGFVVLLDGFDEIHTGATARERGGYLKHLLSLLASPSPCILSTRPTYFNSFREMNEAFNHLLDPKATFERLDKSPIDPNHLLKRLDISGRKTLSTSSLRTTLQLLPLTRDRVLAYLKNCEAELVAKTGTDIESTLTFLEQIYDIRDLMSRPLLLNMIVVTIVEGTLNPADKTASIGPSTLYDLYTQICAARDGSKRGGRQGGQYLKPELRLAACRELAMSMLRKGSIELTATEVDEALDRVPIPVKKSQGEIDKRELRERSVTDIRLCSFLSFSDDGSVRFGHKSFFEFFVAQYFLVEVATRFTAITELARHSITREMIGFLGSYARDDKTFAVNVASAFHNRGGDKDTTDALFHRVMFASGELLSGTTLKKANIHDADLKRAEVDGVTFDQCRLMRLEVDHVTATNWAITQSTMADCALRGSTFRDSTLTLRGVSNKLLGLSLTGCALAWHGEQWDAEDVAIDGGTVNMDAVGHIRNLSLANLKLTIGPVAGLKIASTATIDNCTIIQVSVSSWCEQSSKATITNSTLLGLFVPSQDISGASASGFTLSDCHGVVLTRSSGGALQDVGYTPRSPWGPNICLVDVQFLEDALRYRNTPQPPLTPNDSEATIKRHREEAARRIKAGALLDFLTSLAVLRDNLPHLTGLLHYAFHPKEAEGGFFGAPKLRKAPRAPARTRSS